MVAIRIRGFFAPRYVQGDFAVVAVSDVARSEDTVAKQRDAGIVFKKLQVVSPMKASRLYRFINFNEQYAPPSRTAEQMIWIYPVDSVIQKLRR